MRGQVRRKTVQMKRQCGRAKGGVTSGIVIDWSMGENDGDNDGNVRQVCFMDENTSMLLIRVMSAFGNLT